MLNKLYSKLNVIEVSTFKLIQSNKPIPFINYVYLFIKGFLSLIESIIRNISGPFGYLIRRIYYKMVFKKMGKDVLIDVGVILNGSQNITCGNKVWIDTYTVINVQLTELIIGNNVHIHTHVFMGGREKIILKDNSGISSGTKLFTGGAQIMPKNKIILNPMIEEYDPSAINSGPIVVEENATILSNCVISPNVEIKKGSMVLSSSFVNRSTKEFSINVGGPAQQIGERPEE